MVVKLAVRSWEHAADAMNLVFGAAIGTYLGAIVASQGQKPNDVYSIAGILFTLVLFVGSVTSIPKFFFEKRHGDVIRNVVVCLIGLLIIYLLSPSAGLSAAVSALICGMWLGSTILFMISNRELGSEK